MNPSIRWAVLAGALLIAAGVGFWSYQAGMAHGIERSAKIVVATPAPALTPGGVPYPYPYPYYGWHRPWGGGFFFAPFLFFILGVIGLRIVLRGLFWRGPFWRGPRYAYPGYGCGGRDRFDEWHRQAHAGDWPRRTRTRR